MFGFLKRLRNRGRIVRRPIIVRIDATEKGRIRTLDDMAKLPAHAIIVALGVDADGDVCEVSMRTSSPTMVTCGMYAEARKTL